MNHRIPLALTGLLIATSASAQPYQFEAAFAFLNGEESRGRFSNDSDTISLSGSYYLRPVETALGPLQEKAFLDKASSVTLDYSDVDRDGGNGFDSIGLNGRFVTQGNFIFNAGYDDTSSDGGGSSDTLSLGVGKYFDDWADILFSFTTNNDADFDTFSVETRRVNPGNQSGTWWSYELGAGFIDAGDDNGYGLELTGIYFPSSIIGLRAGLMYTKIDDSKVQELELAARYFFTQTLAGRIFYSMVDRDFTDTDTIGFGITGRF